MKWPDARLRDLCSTITKGTTPRTLGKEYTAIGIPFLRAENLQGDRIVIDENTLYIDEDTNHLLSRSVIQPNDVLISIAGTIGRCAIVSSDASRMNCNQAVAIVRIEGDLYPRYLLYWLKSDSAQSQMTGAKVTGTISNLSLAQIGNLQLPLPPLDEQHRIVRVLDEAEALRQLRARANERMADFIPALFNQMFGDPATNPKGWKVAPVSTFVDEFQGGRSILTDGAETEDTKYRILKVSAVTWGEYQPQESKPVPSDYEPLEHHFVRKGDLLFSRANTTALVGATVYVFDTPENIVLSDKLWRFVWHEPQLIDPLYVWALFLNQSIRRELGSRATGTGGSMKNISKPKVLSMPVPLPPLALQRDFAARVAEARAVQDQQARSWVKLEAGFQALIHRAFSGEL